MVAYNVNGTKNHSKNGGWNHGKPTLGDKEVRMPKSYGFGPRKKGLGGIIKCRKIPLKIPVFSNYFDDKAHEI